MTTLPYSLSEASKDIVKYGLPRTASVNGTVALATVSNVRSFSLSDDYLDVPMGQKYNFGDYTKISASRGKPLCTSGMGPCMALVYAVEVVDRTDPKKSIGWIYGLHHMGIGMSDYDSPVSTVYGRIYQDMITKVVTAANTFGTISQRKGFLVPGASSARKEPRTDNFRADMILQKLRAVGPIDNNWKDIYALYKNDTLSVTVVVNAESGNLVISAYEVPEKVRNQAAVQSIDISGYRPSRAIKPTKEEYETTRNTAKEDRLTEILKKDVRVGNQQIETLEEQINDIHLTVEEHKQRLAEKKAEIRKRQRRAFLESKKSISSRKYRSSSNTDVVPDAIEEVFWT